MSQNQFSEAQISDFQEAFGLYDKDGDGYLNSSDLGVAIRSVGGVITDSEIGQMVKEVDDKKNGLIDFADFLAFMATAFKQGEYSEDDDLLAAFQAFDREGNGLISVAELRHMMTKLGEKLSEEDVEEVIREADSEGTGQIDYKEFVKMITS